MNTIKFMVREFFEGVVSLFRDNIVPALQNIQQFFASMLSPSVEGSITWYIRKWIPKRKAAKFVHSDKASAALNMATSLYPNGIVVIIDDSQYFFFQGAGWELSYALDDIPRRTWDELKREYRQQKR